MKTFAPVKRIQTISYDIYIFFNVLCTNALTLRPTQKAACNIQRKLQSSDGNVVLASSAQCSEGIA